MRMQHRKGGAIPPFLALLVRFRGKGVAARDARGDMAIPFGARGPVGLGRSLREWSGGRPKCGHLADASTLDTPYSSRCVRCGSTVTLLAQADLFRSPWWVLASRSMASRVAPRALKRATTVPWGQSKTKTSGSERSRA